MYSIFLSPNFLRTSDTKYNRNPYNWPYPDLGTIFYLFQYFNKNLFCCGREDENERGRGRGGRNLLACGAKGCVSMSNSAHHVYGDRVNGGGMAGEHYRNQNGVRSGAVGGIYRGSAATTNYSLGINSNSKMRKCTWESPKDSTHQILMTNLNVIALNNTSPRHGVNNFPLTSISLTSSPPKGVQPKQRFGSKSPCQARGSLESSPCRARGSLESSPNGGPFYHPSPKPEDSVEIEEIKMTTFSHSPISIRTIENAEDVPHPKL